MGELVEVLRHTFHEHAFTFSAYRCW